MKRLLFACALALCAAPGAAFADDGEHDGDTVVVERGEFTIGRPHERPIGAVVADNQLGDLRIEGHDGDAVTIVAVKHAPDHATLERLRVVAVPDTDGTIRLSTTLRDRAGADAPPVSLASVRIDLVLRVPRNARVEGRVSRGRLEVVNTDAGADLDAGAGQISVRNVAGLVQARSLDGNQRFEDVFGTLESHAVDADVALDTVRGQALSAQVYTGDIDGQGVSSRQVRVSTVNGNIDLEAEPQAGGSLTVTSLRGNVDVKLRGTLGVTVRARAGGTLKLPEGSSGTIDRADRWVEAQYGPRRSRAAVRIESRYGDLAFSLGY